jgi:transcription initiation factor TFIID subunit 13
MMHGFGDDANPLPESVKLMEEMVLQYMSDLIKQARNVSPLSTRLKTEALLFAVRKNRQMLDRAKQLLDAKALEKRFRDTGTL